MFTHPSNIGFLILVICLLAHVFAVAVVTPLSLHSLKNFTDWDHIL